MNPNNAAYRNLVRLLGFFVAPLLPQILIAQLASIAQSPVSAPPQPVLKAPVLANPSQIIGSVNYSVTQIGPDSRVWKSSTGQSVTAIGTGMNYWDGQKWNLSDPSFSVSADGNSFIAQKLQAPTQLAANIATQGSVSVVTPDGILLRSTPLAIGLYDARSGKSVILASVTNSTGVLVDPQHVVYAHAFVGGGLDAGIVYSLPDTGSFHQDVVFTGFDPNFDPTDWGFAANATNTLQLEIFTEFFTPPQPQTLQRSLYVEQNPNLRESMSSPDFIDNFLDFGHYVFGTGKAYPSSIYNVLTPGSAVAKDFVTSDGRTFLIENIRFRDIAGPLQALPSVKVKTSSLRNVPGARKMKVAAASLPQPQPIKSESKAKLQPAKLTASGASLPKGVAIDYIATVSSLNEPTLYTSDTTYFVTNTVYLTSPVTMESAVFKFPTNNMGELVIENTLTMATTNYRPAIFTAADDNTAGAPLNTSIWSSYTGTPGSNPYGSVAVCLETSANVALNNLRFNYIYYAFALASFTAGQTFSISDTQISQTTVGMLVVGQSGLATANLTLDNCLIDSTGFPISANSIPLTLNAYNCTIDASSVLFDMATSTGSLNFTNSIFSSAASMGSWSPMTLTGGHNGFYNCPSYFGTTPNVVSSSPYVTAWAGYYYLSPGSVCVTSATTNVPGAVLSHLGSKTTQAPQTLSGPLFTMNTTLAPVVQRDTTGLALGFHYDALDYWGACIVSNATLTISPGVALAYYDNCLMWLKDGSSLVSQGTPNQRNYIAYFGQVQEQPNCYYPVTNFMARLIPLDPLPDGGTALPSIDLRLTTICAPTGETNLWFSSDYGGNNVIKSLTLQDCEVYCSGANWQMSESVNTPTVGFTNNVFYRAPFAVNSNAKITSFNNLYYGTTNTNEFTISILHRSGAPSPNTHENDVFDGVKATLDGTVGYNAYVNGATNTSFTNNHDIITNITWQGGPLGFYYQPSASPLLTNGSTSATNLGLYHYAVLTNETVDGTNIVSRGYHYVALGANGLPIDTNGDGIPDYLEDANGNGIVDSGEIGWNIAGDLGFSVTITQPANNSITP
ncbi:MAG TPA: hypothetical protein VGO67_15260 [Verrucomicrobiae bacterium]|jgi:hypothetical protein